jgi:hypothetical protein
MNTLNLRSYGLVIVFALVLFAGVVLGLANNWGIFRQPSREASQNADIANPLALEDGASDLASLDLLMVVKPPSNSEEVRQAEIGLSQVTFYVRDDSDEVDATKVCLEFVEVYTNPLTWYDTREAAYEDGHDHHFISEPLCTALTDDDFDEEDVLIATNTLADNVAIVSLPMPTAMPFKITNPTDVSLNFWYPYDRFQLELMMVVGYRVEYSDGTSVLDAFTPYMAWDIQTSGLRLWDVRLTNTIKALDLATDDGEAFALSYSNVAISFERPLLYRLIFPFFIILMVLLIGLVPLLGDKDTLINICATMLFGIFGLKGILGPGEAMGQTVLDLALLMLYVILAFAGILFFINKINLRRQAQTDTSQTEKP